MEPSSPQTQPLTSNVTPARPAAAASQGEAIAKKSGGALEIVGLILTVILLLFFFPLGLLLMWFFTRWPKVVKIMITLFFVVLGGILLMVGMTVSKGLHSGARDAQRRNDIQSISKVLEEHFDTKAGQYLPPQSSWFVGGRIPQDPAGGNYQGIPTSLVTQFKICARLENTNYSSGPKDFCLESQR